MKTLRYIFTAGVLMSALCAWFVACNEPKGSERNEGDSGDVPFMELSQEEILGQWKNLTFGEVTIINSQDEMEAHYDGETLPEIDLSNNTLLLANGVTSAVVNKVMIKGIKELSEQEYRLTVEIFVTDMTAPGYWQVAILTDKFREGNEVELNTVINNNY